MKKKAIFGVGGLAKELYYQLLDKNILFVVDDNYLEKSIAIDDKKIISLSQFNSHDYEIIIALSDANTRLRVFNQLPKDTSYWSFIHPSVELNSSIKFGKGAIFMKNSILTTSIEIGDFPILHSFVVIAHDSKIGSFFCATYGAKVSGNVKIGDNVFLGTNSSIKENIKICDNVVLGIGAVAVKDIFESGKYAGVPCKKI